MSICGEVQQSDVLNFHIHDNLDRDNVTVTALVHFGQETRSLDISNDPDEEYSYGFVFSQNKRGVAILELSVDGVQVPESPWRVEVIERVCHQSQMTAVSKLYEVAVSAFLVQLTSVQSYGRAKTAIASVPTIPD